jgi:hypothetical protein
LWRADGFAVLVSRLKTTSFSLRTNTHEQEADDALDTGEAAGLDDDSALANADLSDSDSASATVSQISQGDDLWRVLPPRDDDDPFWLCRVVHVGDGVGHNFGQQFLVNYYYELVLIGILQARHSGHLYSSVRLNYLTVHNRDRPRWYILGRRRNPWGHGSSRVHDIRLREAA